MYIPIDLLFPLLLIDWLIVCVYFRPDPDHEQPPSGYDDMFMWSPTSSRLLGPFNLLSWESSVSPHRRPRPLMLCTYSVASYAVWLGLLAAATRHCSIHSHKEDAGIEFWNSRAFHAFVNRAWGRVVACSVLVHFFVGGIVFGCGLFLSWCFVLSEFATCLQTILQRMRMQAQTCLKKHMHAQTHAFTHTLFKFKTPSF